ncbi:MAG: hypothetical protein RIQ34_880 [Bacteroidota bacterium]
MISRVQLNSAHIDSSQIQINAYAQNYTTRRDRSFFNE